METFSTWVTKRKEVGVRTVDAKEDPLQSGAEEVANSISCGIGLIAASVGNPILIIDKIRYGNGRFIVGGSVFLMLYFTSSVYHGLTPSKAKRIFSVIEHTAIFQS